MNGSGYDSDGYVTDTHATMKDEDYRLLEWVLSISKPRIVTLEYDGVEGETSEVIRNNIKTQLRIINDLFK